MSAGLLRAVCLAVAMAALPVQAEVFPVDDSASQVMQAGPVKMRWDSIAPTPGRPPTISGQLTVLVRLDVSPWQGRAARIYQRLAPVASGPVTATWSAHGPLLPGKLQDGGRTLVYSGVLTSARLEDTFRIHIQADGERVQRPQDLVFTFEIELETP